MWNTENRLNYLSYLKMSTAKELVIKVLLQTSNIESVYPINHCLEGFYTYTSWGRGQTEELIGNFKVEF